MKPQTSLSAPPDATSALRSNRYVGFCLAGAAVLLVTLMALHPTSGAHDSTEFVKRVGRGVPGNTFVHGSLITLILFVATCMLALRDVLGAHRLIVRAGLVALVVGTAAGAAAGLINGFIVPNVAARFMDADGGQIDALRPVLVSLREANASCARLCVVGLSLAAAAWSVCLLRMPGWRRVAGCCGLVCGLVPLALHAAEHLRMDVPGFGLFVQIHACWVFVAGLVLIRWPPPEWMNVPDLGRSPK